VGRKRLEENSLETVIASEAKQSIPHKKEEWIASSLALLAMTIQT
jgi:hypothetical protein